MINTRIISVPKENSGGNVINNIVNNTSSSNVNVDNGEFVTVKADSANITNLTSTTINATNVNATEGEFENLTIIDTLSGNEIDATLVDADSIKANDGNITNLTSTSGTITTLSSTTATITNSNGTTLNYQDANLQGNLNVGDTVTINGDLFGTYGEFSMVDSTTIDTSNINVDGQGTFDKSKNGSLFKTVVQGDEIKLTKSSSQLNTTIAYNNISTPNVDTNNINSNDGNFDGDVYIENATIQDLLVTGSAHFYELIIDKIKATQGQLILTPANAKIIKVEQNNTYYKCYFQATDKEGNAIYNPFYTNDYVVCQNFNVSAGLSTNVSNKFYWYAISDVEDTQTETVTVNGADIDCWSITINTNGAKHSSTNGVPQEGDEIVQLGNSSVADRQSAIIISAYRNQYLDPTIIAPSIVQYNGINDFNLSNHRVNVMSKGLNTFKGNFTTSTGDDIEELIQNNSFVIKALYPTYQALIAAHPTGIQGEAYAVGTEASNVVYIWDVDTHSWKNIGALKGPQGAKGDKGDTGDKGDKGDNGENAIEFVIDPTIEKAEIDSNGNLDVKFGYDVYRIEGNTVTSLSLSSNGYYLVVEADSSSVPTGVELQHKVYNSNYTKNDYITDYYNVPTNQRPNGFYVYLVYQNNDNYVEGVAARYVRILYSPMASLQVKTTVNEQGETIGQINATVAGHTSSINSLTNNVSQLQIQADGISATVQSHTTSIGDLNDDVSDLNSDISSINGQITTINNNVSSLQVQADNITTNVTNVTNKVNNMKVGSTQLLRGINKMGSLTTSADATWDKSGWVVTSGGNGTGNQFTLTDSPNKLCSVGWRISNNTSGNRDFAQYKFPWVKGQEYTVSGYARAINGSGASLLIRCWDNTAAVARMTYTKTLSSGSWQYFSYTFTLPTTTDINNSQFAFGLSGNCSAEFCCLKLEKGNLATDFSENPNDVETELNTLTTDVSEVKQTATSLTSTVTTLQNQVNAIPIEKTVTIDATSLDVNTFYPVSIKFNFSVCPATYIRCKVYRGLDSTYGVPSYSTHQWGFIVDLDWNCKAGGWGANEISNDWSENDKVRIINDYYLTRVTSGEYAVGSIRQNWMQSTEIVYVRGGSKYDISTSWSNSTITLHPNGYSWTSGSYSYSSPTKSASQIVVPIKDAMSKSQIEQTAKGITSTVTSQILHGDTNNLLYPACYNSDGMTNEQNQFFVTSILGSTDHCTSWGCQNLTKYGKPIINSSTSQIEIGSTGEVYLYTPWIALTANQMYSLTFGGNCTNTMVVELCRYSSLTNAIKANQTIAATTTIRTIPTDTFTYNSTVIKFTPTTTSSYYRIRFQLTSTTSATPILNLNCISLYSGDIAVGGFADWNYGVSKATSTIAQTADSIKLGVEKAGINLTSGKITSIADNFEWQNNEGETILGMNSNGDAEFAGTIKAKNFYHSISLAQWIDAMDDQNYNVKYHINAWLYVTDANTLVNDSDVEYYCSQAELSKIHNGDLIDLNDTTNWPGLNTVYNLPTYIPGAVPCIGYADEAIFMTTTGSTSGSKYVILPPASKCPNKIVTVYNKAYSNIAISVKSANSSDRLSAVAYYSGNQALVSGNSGQTMSLSHNQWIKFIALSNGWFAMANGTSSFN